jgi:SAM-dependent methyltransferase
MICHICQSTDGATYRAREMMFGFRDEFTYFECGGCGCVQLTAPPLDLGRYYPPDYYSFRPPAPRRPGHTRLWRWLATGRDEAQLFRTGGVFGALAALRPNPILRFPAELGDLPGLRPTTRVLDVGCGAGRLLVEMAEIGFRNLTGVDPYLTGDHRPADAVRLLARPLEKVDDGPYDLIMFHHSLEHMPDQHRTMKSVRSLLASGGTCVIRVPSASSTVWKEYRSDWVELDAPRHFFLHTHDSLDRLARANGFRVAYRVCDSDGFAYWGSELYRMGLTLLDPVTRTCRNPADHFSAEQLSRFEADSERDNRELLGGRVLVHLRADV